MSNLSFARFAPWRFLILILAAPLVLSAAPSRDVEKEGTMIIEHWMKSKAVDSELAYLHMQMLDESGETESRKFLAVYRREPDGGSQFLVRLTEPEEVKGVTLLAKKTAAGASQQSIYLPSIGTMRPLSGEAQSAPFLGSDFSYADLLEEIPSEQTYERLPDRFIHGSECYVVKATPRDPESSPYGHREIYLDKITFDLLRIDFFGPDDVFSKYLAAYEYNSPRIAGRSTRPHRAVMTDIESNTSTIMTVIQSRVNEGVPAEIFTAESIENWTDEAIEAFVFDKFMEVNDSPLELD